MKLGVAFITSILATAASGFLFKRDPPAVISPPTLGSVALHRRAEPPLASDDVWAKAKCYGEKFVKVFSMTDADAGKVYTPPRDSVQSRWTGDLVDELKTWGWTENKLPNSVCEFDEFAFGKGWVDAMKELGVKTEGWKDIWCYRFSHGSPWDIMRGKKYKVDNKDYPYTGAYGQFGINAADGAILAMDNLMPSSAFRQNYQRDPKPEELPALQSLSDILWGGWYRGSQPETSKNPNVANVKYLISISITNAESLSIIQRALKAKSKTTVSFWPGDTFEMSTAEGQALLGSANGRRWGYLLTQRKSDVGIKKVDRVTIFRGKEYANPIMIFHAE